MSGTLQVEAGVEGSSAVPGLAALVVRVRFVNARPPAVTVDTLTASGRAEVPAGAPSGTFIAHLSAADPDRGPNGQVTCRLVDHGGAQFRLVRMFAGEYKMLTARSVDDVAAGEVLVAGVRCDDHADPPRSTRIDVRVTVTPSDHAGAVPTFSQRVYNATLPLAGARRSAPAVFVIRVLAAAAVAGQPNVSYSLSRPYAGFSIDRWTGVVRAVAGQASGGSGGAVELDVVATAGDGRRAATATINVAFVPPDQVRRGPP